MKQMIKKRKMSPLKILIKLKGKLIMKMKMKLQMSMIQNTLSATEILTEKTFKPPNQPILEARDNTWINNRVMK